MTIAAFCDSEGLTTSAYSYWQRELKRRDAESRSEAASSQAAFATVQLVNDRSNAVCGDAADGETADVGAAAVEVVAPNGFVVRVREQATAEHVRRVVQAVAQLNSEAT